MNFALKFAAYHISYNRAIYVRLWFCQRERRRGVYSPNRICTIKDMPQGNILKRNEILKLRSQILHILTVDVMEAICKQ